MRKLTLAFALLIVTFYSYASTETMKGMIKLNFNIASHLSLGPAIVTYSATSKLPGCMKLSLYWPDVPVPEVLKTFKENTIHYPASLLGNGTVSFKVPKKLPGLCGYTLKWASIEVVSQMNNEVLKDDIGVVFMLSDENTIERDTYSASCSKNEFGNFVCRDEIARLNNLSLVIPADVDESNEYQVELN